MKVSILGEFTHDWSTKMSFKLAFEEEGHEVYALQDDFVGTEEILRIAQGGLLFYIPTHANPIDGKLWDLLEKFRGPKIAAHFDLYWGIKSREPSIGQRPFWKFDHVFTPDGGNQDRFRQRGVNHHYLPPPVSTRFIGRGKWRRRYAHDVCFVGARNHHQEWPYRPQLIGWLEKTYGERFAHYGEGQPRLPIWGNNLNDLYASCKVIVGDSVRSDYYWSNRVPETLGREGLLIHPRIRGMAEHYPEDTLLYYDYGDFDYLKHLIDANINHPDTSRPVKGRQVAENHTYHHWVREVMEWV